MRVAVTGATGLIGSALSTRLESDGHEVIAVSRTGPASTRRIVWDPEQNVLDPAAFAGLDAVVHLAGENIAGRWTAKKKRSILESRAHGTRVLVQALHRLPADERPLALLSSSAIGFYGDRGDEELPESASSGTDFLARVCREWEAPTNLARGDGMRVVQLRTGIVLSGRGGPLVAMARPFRMGLGGRVGDGRQFMAWISLYDEVEAILFLLKDPSISGPVNLVSPNPVRNAEFVEALGHVLDRPTLLPLPAAMVKLVFGEMGRSLLLVSQRVLPRRLTDAGFRFRHPGLPEALKSAFES